MYLMHRNKSIIAYNLTSLVLGNIASPKGEAVSDLAQRYSNI